MRSIEEATEASGGPEVVGVEVGDPGAGREGDPRVAGDPGAHAGLCEEPDAAVGVAAGDFGRGVGGTVVDDDDLCVDAARVDVGEGRLERRGEVSLAVVHGDDDRDLVDRLECAAVGGEVRPNASLE